MLLSYEDYIKYGGKMEEAAFSVYGYEAEQEVNAQTAGRIKAANERIGRCIARVADLLQSADVTQDNVSSWSNDGVSESYVNVSSAEYTDKINGVIYSYLINERDESGTPLLYRGVTV